MTDEVFAAAISRLSRDNRSWSEDWMLGIARCAWLSWVAGTLAGVYSGNDMLDDWPVISAALGFILPALFLSFLLAAFQRRKSLVLAASLVGALAGLLVGIDPHGDSGRHRRRLSGGVAVVIKMRRAVTSTVFIIGCVVETANFLFCCLPLRLAGNVDGRPLHNDPLGRVLESIGIAAICALLVVSTLPDILQEPQHNLPALAGFLTLTALFYRTRSIVMATLFNALAYGVVYKFLLTF